MDEVEGLREDPGVLEVVDFKAGGGSVVGRELLEGGGRVVLTCSLAVRCVRNGQFLWLVFVGLGIGEELTSLAGWDSGRCL